MLRTQIRQAREDGFTLIELLIVIVILGILAGLVVFGVSSFRGDSVTAACKADVKNVQVAVEAFAAKTGKYPASANADAAAASAERFTALTTPAPGYLKAAPASADYTILITDNNGTVTGTKSVANGGGAC